MHCARSSNRAPKVIQHHGDFKEQAKDEADGVQPSADGTSCECSYPVLDCVDGKECTEDDCNPATGPR